MTTLNFPCEVVFAYQENNRTSVYNLIKAQSQAQVDAELQATKDRIRTSYDESEIRWEKVHGANWLTAWKETFGRDFYDQLADRLDMQVMTWEAFEVQQKAELIKPGQLNFLSHAEWWYFLEVLPPEHQERNQGMETFLMCEYWTSTYTSQYVSSNAPELLQQLNLPMDTYVCAGRMVDATDRTTWITFEELCQAALANRDEVIAAIERGDSEL